VRSVATKAPEVADYSNQEIVSATAAALQPCYGSRNHSISYHVSALIFNIVQ
jgi:hypothetical protein